MFLGLLDLHPNPLDKGTDPRPDPNQNVTDTQHCFVEIYVFLPKKIFCNKKFDLGPDQVLDKSLDYFSPDHVHN